MADIEKSIAACCKQLKLPTNFAGQAFEQKGDTPQEYLLNLLTNEIEYRTARRKSKLQIPVERYANSNIIGMCILI